MAAALASRSPRPPAPVSSSGLALRKRVRLGRIASASSAVPGKRGQLVEIALADARTPPPRSPDPPSAMAGAGPADARSKSGWPPLAPVRQAAWRQG